MIVKKGFGKKATIQSAFDPSRFQPKANAAAQNGIRIALSLSADDITKSARHTSQIPRAKLQPIKAAANNHRPEVFIITPMLVRYHPGCK